MDTRQEITTRTKQNIIDAFWIIYCEKGIENVTVKEIANKAGYNRGTFYEYFADAYDVLNRIEDALIPNLDELPPISSSTRSFGMPLDAFLDVCGRNARYYSVLLGDKGDPAFAGKLKNSVKPTIMRVFQDKTGINLKEMDYVLEYTLSAMIGIMNYWFSQEDALPGDQLFELIHRVMQEGIMKQLPL